jgi:hypothetical protein
MRGDDPLIVRDLRIAAYLVIVCWGIVAASHILSKSGKTRGSTD